MITVVHVITKLELGGAQENTLYTCRSLDRRRFRVVLLHGPDGLLDEEARAIPDAQIEIIPSLVRAIDPRLDVRCFAELKGKIVDLRAEHARLGESANDLIVHTHSSKAGILGRLAARAAGVRNIVHTIHGFGFHPAQSFAKQRLLLSLELAASRVTTAFISVSRANLAEARTRGIVRPEHTALVIRSGFDLAAFEEKTTGSGARREEIRDGLGILPGQGVIVSIANLKPQKDPLTLVAAMKKVREARPNTVLLFAGDGGLRRAVERAIAEADLRQNFRLLGWRRDVPELMSAADVVVLSSIFEGLPRVAVEALAAQRPFVGTRVDGTPEVIRAGKNGYLVEPRSPDQLACALLKALELRPTDPKDLDRIQAWDQDRMVREQAALYESLSNL